MYWIYHGETERSGAARKEDENKGKNETSHFQHLSAQADVGTTE